MNTTMEIEVADIRKIVGDSKLRALADVRVADCLVIKGFCVFEGRNGVFVGMPKKAAKDGTWVDIVEVNESLKRQIEMKVLESFDREIDGVKG